MWGNNPWVARTAFLRKHILPHYADCSRARGVRRCEFGGIETDRRFQRVYRRSNTTVAKLRRGFFSHMPMRMIEGVDPCLALLRAQFVSLLGDSPRGPQCEAHQAGLSPIAIDELW